MLINRGDIINHMIRTLGEHGVSYTQSTHPTVQTCNATLDSESIEFQRKGWWFNTETDYKLVPNELGEVILPPSALQVVRTNVSFMSPNEKKRYVSRGGKLYDTIRHTSVLNQSISVTLVLGLSLDDLPPTALNYLKHKSAEIVYLNDDFEEGKLSKLERSRLVAWHDVMAEQFRVTGMNALDSPAAQNLLSGLRPNSLSRNPNFIGGRG